MNPAVISLVDCGTSRIKGARLQAAARHPDEVADLPSPEPRWGPRGECEVDPQAIADGVRQVLKAASHTGSRQAAAIYLCTEMHGFLVADEQLRPRTAYIGWRDARAAMPDASGRCTLNELEHRIGGRFQAITGMSLRAGLPAVNLAFLEAAGLLPERFTFLSLADWIAVSLGQWRHRAHVTMAGSSGLLDIATRRWSVEILEAIGIRRSRIFLPDVAEDEETPIGSATTTSRATPLFAGAGDLQCTALGAGVPWAAEICVNMGTGSQVVTMARTIQPEGAELRPYFAGGMLFARTHIPAGRMLDYFAGFFADVAGTDSKARFWSLLQSLDAREIGEAPLEVDPNVFPGSWKFGEGGKVTRLREGVLSARSFVASIAKGWLRQYADAISEITGDKPAERVVLAGGLPRRLPWVAAALAAAARCTVLPLPPGEDTLNGLAFLTRRPS